MVIEGDRLVGYNGLMMVREEKEREKLLEKAFETGDKQAFSKLLEDEVKNLSRFVRHEISYYKELGDIRGDEIQSTEVVDEAVLSAFKDFQEKPKNLPLDYWLYGRALSILRRLIDEIKESEERQISYDRNIPDVPLERRPQKLGDEVLDFWQIDEDLGMEDIIADDRIEASDEMISKKELSKQVHKWLAQLPESWRVWDRHESAG